MNRNERRAAEKQLQRDNATWPIKMTPVPEPWPLQSGVKVLRVWRSRQFIAQFVREERTKGYRLSVNRSELDSTGGWKDGITWEELQRIKLECGFTETTMVEVYPAERDVVNVANIRHLWIVDEDFPYVWRDKR